MPMLIKQGLLVFWAVWSMVVLVTNISDGLKAAGLLGGGWRFASGNWRRLQETTAIYRVPAWINTVLFAGVLAWQALVAVLMWRGALAFGGAADAAGMLAVYRAFGAALAQFAALVVVDEILLAYPAGAAHLQVFLTLLASLLAIRLLPDG